MVVLELPSLLTEIYLLPSDVQFGKHSLTKVKTTLASNGAQALIKTKNYRDRCGVCGALESRRTAHISLWN